MQQDLLRAKAALPGHSCVLCKEDRLIIRDQRGVAPLLELLGEDLQGFSVADKVVGKAAAMLYCLMKVACVWSPVMSRGAVQMLQSHGITALYESCPEAIINRAGDGICPMEQTVAAISQPADAPQALRQTLRKLRGD